MVIIMELLAVYGTLKSGHYNHSVIDDATFIGPATLPGWEMYSLGAFPAIVPSDDSNETVYTEVWGVPNLERTDTLEGFPNFYNRKKVDTPYGEVWVYYMESVPKRTTLKIDSGMW